MTAICGGGTSSSRAGFGASVALTVPAIAALLNNIPTVWAVPFAAYLGLINYDLGNFCSADPPPVPTITAADAAALLTVLDPIGHTVALAKFQQLVGAYAWYSLCKCDSVATPAPPTPPSPPSGLPQINPPSVGPSYPTGLSCATARILGDTPEAISYGSRGYNPLNGATNITLAVTATGTRATVGSQGWGIGAFTANRTFISQMQGFALDSSGVTIGGGTGLVPANAVYWAYSANAISGYNGVEHYIADVEFFCGSGPGSGSGPVPVPCPPDFITQGLLQQILDLVTLIQRQKAPFAYVPGARHNGLTGNGQIAVAGLIGVSVILSTVPAYLGNIAGDPPELFDVGFVTLGTADGWHRSVRIEHSPTLVFPVEGSETLLGWSLAPGVVADLLELRREP